MKTAYRSHIGNVRQINEDQVWVGHTGSGLTAAIVADGMGGHLAGEVASALAVDNLVESLAHWETDLSAEDSENRLRELIRKANRSVYDAALANPNYRNMGTTVVVALLGERQGLIGHIGDSRAYLIRGGAFEQLTEDHTLVNELVKSGQIRPEEAAYHPHRNVMTRALGTDREVLVDVRRIDWQAGDCLLLCSDGLSGFVEEEKWLEAMAETDADLEQKAQRLVDLALAAGGGDNVSVALIGNDGKADEAGGESA
jgi:protein phosphatase